MKKIYLFISVMLIMTAAIAGNLKPIAQKISDRKSIQGTFTRVQLFDITGASQQRSGALESTVKNATVMEFRQLDAQVVVRTKPENINLIIPTGSGMNIELELFKTEISHSDFSVVTSSSNGQAIPYEGGVHYQGIVKGDNSSIAAISIFNDEVMGMISFPNGGNMILGKLEHDAQGMHILYNEHDLTAPPTMHCSTAEARTGYSSQDLSRTTVSAAASNKCIRLYWECNYDLYQNKGNTTAVTNYLTGLFNQSAILYSNDSINVTLAQLYIWTTASPYVQTSTSALLTQFNTTRTSFNGDLGILIGLAGGGGIAYVNGICSSNQIYSEGYTGISTSYNTVPAYSWSVEVVTHEQGHLMGSQHTHACVWNGNNTAIDGCGPAAGYGYEGSCTGAPVPAGGGTIMSYCHLIGVGINFSLGFGPQPRTLILNRISSGTCLSSCGATACSAPTGMTTSAITTSAATFNWTAATGANSYTINYRIVGTSTWTSASTVSTSYNASGLASGTNYEWQVLTVCSSGSSPFTSSTTFTTTASACNTPSGMSTTAITTSTATFNWTAASGATSYSIRYRITGTTTWTTSSSASTSYNASALTANTTYEWQVQTICSSGSSAFTASTTFTTTAAPCNVASGMNTTAVTSSSATFNWTAVSGASSYNIRYRITGTTTWSTGSSATASYNASGLTANSTYEWQVQTVCSGGSSVFTASTTFTTSSAPCNVPTGMSTSTVTSSSATFNWTAVSGATSYLIRYRITGTTTWTSSSSSTATYSASGLTASSNYEWQILTVCSGGSSAYTASITFTTSSLPCTVPAGMNTTAVTASSATFNWTAVSGATSYTVQYRITGTLSWLTFSTVSPSYSASGLTVGSTYEWQVLTVCGAGSSAFPASTLFTTSSSPCNAPVGMNTTSIATSSAIFNWTAVSGAVSYNIQYRIVGTTVWTSTNTVAASYNASGLALGSNYEWQIQTNCSGGSSAFTASTTFTTTVPACNTPVGMNTTAVAVSSATFNWTAVQGAISYNVRYRITGTATWTTVNTAAATYSATALTSSATYEWQVQTVCSGGSSTFSASTTFVTPAPPCTVPTGLTTTNITGSSVTLSWTAVSGSIGYNLQWKLSSATSWTTVSAITTSSYILPGLTACTGYQFQVQTVCLGSLSGFSSVASFITTGCSIIYCTSKGTNTNYEYINKVVLGSINNTSGSNAGYGNYTGLSTNLTGGSSNTISMTPGFPGSAYREYWSVWIDYNHNGLFTDAGENVAIGNGTGDVNSSFTVPVNALNGSTRMRIQMQYNSQQTNSCATYTYGEVEDYTVVIIGNAQIPTTPTPGTIGSNTQDGLFLYPNPAKDNLTAEFMNGINGKVKINVYDVIGKLMMTTENKFLEGTNNLNVNISALPNGLYIFEIENNGEIKRQKFMVSR